MSRIFDNDVSDLNSNFETNNEYAKNYNNWRQKEEVNRLKTKYGEDILNANNEDSSSSSEDDEDGIEITQKLEKDFFKTLSSLKNKDPKIYDDKFSFFDNEPIDPTIKKKKKKEEPMFLKDYERKLLIEKGGHISDSEDETPRTVSPTYVEEQNFIKDNLKDALKNVDDENNDDWGGMFKTRTKTTEEADEEESDYKKWLLGQKQNLEDETTETELKPLKEYWNNPKLEDGEKFLRDYILNKKFLDNDNSDHIPTYEEIVHDSDEGLSEDEEQVDKQEEFEHKYNYRFEEPDQEFIKRYPRTMENSLRRIDDKRTVKRAEVKERKIVEKQQKMEDLKQLQLIKKKEIEEKLLKLREITGNSEVAFEDQDFDADFDPDEHDKRMQKLFNDEFYQGPEDEQKPEFPEIDEELEIERWDKYAGGNIEDVIGTTPHCEDDNFNMDCDYDPSVSTKDELIENSKGKKKRKRKSKFAAAISEPKPIFNPDSKTYEEYLDEYYKLDCEDIVADIPCRFKYRKVIPNSFGLTVEEILYGNDRELNRWCSIKKAIQHRPDHIEKYDQIAFRKKGENEDLKRKLLPSLYGVETAISENIASTSTSEYVPVNKKKRNRGKKTNQEASTNKLVQQKNGNVNTNSVNKKDNTTGQMNKNNKFKMIKNDERLISDNLVDIKDETLIVVNNEDSKIISDRASENKLSIKNNEVGMSKKKIKRKNSAIVNNMSLDDSIAEEKTISITPETGLNTKKSNKKRKNEGAKNISQDVSKATTEPSIKNKLKDPANNNAELTKIKTDINISKTKKKNNKSKKGIKRKLLETDKQGGKNARSFKKSKDSEPNPMGLSDARLKAFGIKPKKFKNKLKYGGNKN